MSVEAVELVEYQESIWDLDPADAEFIGEKLSQQVSIARPVSRSGYILNPRQYVGVVRLPSGRMLRSSTKVDVGCVAYMMAVALDLPQFYRDPAHLRRIDHLLEYIAEYFVELVEQRMRMGLHRAYVEQVGNLVALRGRIDFATDIQLNSVLRHRTYCVFTDLTWNIPENQVIRQVILLLEGQEFSRQLRNRLRTLDTTMSDVSISRFTSRDLPRFTYHRFNSDYAPIHRLCALFLEGASLSEALGMVAGRSFLIDMNVLFERFVTEMLRKKSPRGTTVQAQNRGELDRARLVSIKPDVQVVRGSKTLLVADCKYKQPADEFRNSDVYQVLAYCTATKSSQGLLLYPRTEVARPLSVSVRNTSITISQLTIDLSVPWHELPAEAERFADSVFAYAGNQRTSSSSVAEDLIALSTHPEAVRRRGTGT